jgi:hypothetical protein
LSELISLLPQLTTERELTEALEMVPTLSSRYELNSGFVADREVGNAESLVLNEKRNREKARSNAFYASRFEPIIRNAFRVIAISGSSSYRSASRSNDLDLFCVTASDTMWVALAKSLLMARTFRIFNPGAPQICLSCTMDERYAVRMFTADQGPLFARDALVAIVLDGRETYEALLRKAAWISNIYPILYSSRIRDDGVSAKEFKEASVQTKVLNKLLFLVVGSYLGMKSGLANRKLAKRGLLSSVFRTMAGEDHFVYESARYADLRRMYRESLNRPTAETEASQDSSTIGESQTGANL